MKKLLITYDVRYAEQQGETCTTLEVAEERLGELHTANGGIATMLENTLDMLEFWKNRQYIWGSVKSIEEVSE